MLYVQLKINIAYLHKGLGGELRKKAVLGNLTRTKK